MIDLTDNNLFSLSIREKDKKTQDILHFIRKMR